MPRSSGQAGSVYSALDSVRFGQANILNLRESLPTVAEATGRFESWLRQKQVEGVAEVLVVTGRGNNSPGGVSPVREGVVRLIHSLRRRNVIDRYEEHTPGSFSIQLASIGAMVDAPRRRRERPKPAGIPADASSLSRADKRVLRDLAERSLEALGIKQTSEFMEAEMGRQLASIRAALGGSPDAASLSAALRVALDQLP